MFSILWVLNKYLLREWIKRRKLNTLNSFQCTFQILFIFYDLTISFSAHPSGELPHGCLIWSFNNCPSLDLNFILGPCNDFIMVLFGLVCLNLSPPPRCLLLVVLKMKNRPGHALKMTRDFEKSVNSCYVFEKIRRYPLKYKACICLVSAV